MSTSIGKFDTKKRFIDFYSRPEVQGNISTTCDAVSINRQTYYNWLEKDENFRDLMKEAKMRMCDEMEQVLISRAVEKSDTALIYWLKYNHPQYKEGPQVLIQQNFTKILDEERKEFEL
jgi:hypothetical protein